MNSRPPPPPTAPTEIPANAENRPQAWMSPEAKQPTGLMTPDGFPGPTTALLITARSDAGPACKNMLDLIRTLKSIGVRVFVASPVNPPFGIEFKKIADKFIPVPHRHFSFSALLRLRKSVVKHKISVIHSHGRTAGIYSRLLGVITKASIAHSYHGIANDRGWRGQIKLNIDRVLAQLKFDPVFSSQAERLQAVGKSVVLNYREAVILEPAIDLDRYLKRKVINTALGKVEPTDPQTFSNIRIGALLRPESVNGQENFLRIVRDAGNEGHFTCAGVSRTQLSKFMKIPDGLEVLGPLADPTEWLYSLDVFVSAAREGQAGDALEAMAASAACVLANVGAHEKFRQQNAAVLFDAASPSSFVTALNSIRSDRAMRDLLIANSRYMIERHHDAATFKTKVIELYRTGAKRAAGLVL